MSRNFPPSSPSLSPTLGESWDGFIGIVSPVPTISKALGIRSDFQGPWFDAAHQKILYYSNSSFFWFDPLVTDIIDANIMVRGPVSVPSVAILEARISLDGELVALQLSKKDILVISIKNTERWNLTIKHPESNAIVSPGIVWSDHGGKSQDMVILTERGLELYKVAILRGQCKLSRAMPQRATQYLYEPVHRVLLLTMAPIRSLTGYVLEVNGFFLRFDAFSDMPRLELPPPDKMPPLSLNGVLQRDIYLANLYNAPYCIVHDLGKTGSDDIVLYQISKTGHIRTHILSVPVTGEISITVTDYLLYCHCIESRMTVVFDIMAAQITNQAGVYLEGPICGASMVVNTPFENNSELTNSRSVADEPYTKKWVFFSPLYFWDAERKVSWVVSCNLEAIFHATQEPKRIVPFLCRRGQGLKSYLLPSTGNLDPKVITDGRNAKTLILKKIYLSIIEKVGLTYLQTAFDTTIMPYANECLRLKQFALDELKPESAKLQFKGHKLRYHVLSLRSVTPTTLERADGLDTIVSRHDVGLPMPGSADEPLTPKSDHSSPLEDADETIRRDIYGSIVVTQSEMLSKVWFRLQSDQLVDFEYFTWAQQAYITSLRKAGVKVESFVCVFLCKSLAAQNKFEELAALLRIQFFPDSERTATEILMLTENLSEEKVHDRSKRFVKCIGNLRNYGIEMLWRCGERVKVVKWLLQHGYINDTISICLRRRQHQELSQDMLNFESVRGIEILESAVNAYKLRSDVKEAESLFDRLYVFLRDWDPRVFDQISQISNSGTKLSISKFPDHMFSQDKSVYFNNLYGFT